MKFKVKTREREVELTASELMNLLSQKIARGEPKEDWFEVLSAFLKMLQANEILHTVSIQELGTMLFSLGYYYRVFLTKNEVEIETSNPTSNTESHSG